MEEKPSPTKKRTFPFMETSVYYYLLGAEEEFM